MKLLTCLVVLFAVTSVFAQRKKIKLSDWEQTPRKAIQIDDLVQWLSQSTKPPKPVKLEGAKRCIEILRQEDDSMRWFCRKKLVTVKNDNPFCICFSNTKRGQIVRHVEVN